MSLITTIIDGIAPNPSSGLGGANEGHIQGFQDDIITGVAGGVADKAGGQCLVTQNSPLGMSVLVADGVVYIPNADYIANLATATKYYRVVIKTEDPVTIPSNTSGSDCQHGLDVVVNKVTVPNEYGSNVATLVVTLGTPGAGAPAVPDNGYRLAEVEVVDGATQIANVSISDTRTQISINDVVISTNIVTKTGTQTLSNKTLTSPVINTGISGTAKASAAEVATGTDDTKIVTPLAAAPYANSSMARQAIINGNFDVWQRGTSIALTAADGYTADRWYVKTATAGTDKTVSREDGTGVNGSYYCARVKMVSDVDELLTFSHALESQDSIKFRGKKVTLSFYARGGAEFVADNATLVSKIVTGKGTDQKVLAFTTSADGVSQNNTLTTSWVKFTCTTSAAIASDITQIGVSFAFTHAGSGTTTNYFDIAQVQLCAGDVALPFQPKSYGQELIDCQRYCLKIGDENSSGYHSIALGQCYSTTDASVLITYPVRMRIAPTQVYPTANTLALLDKNGSPVALTAIVDNSITSYSDRIQATVASGFTAGDCVHLVQNNSTATILFSAEL